MALMKGKDLPKDAVKLDELEATEYVWKLVEDWEQPRDVWALRYTPLILGGLNAVSGIMINRFYRQKLKLGSYGYFASVFPITAMPAILTALFHRHSVSTNMLLMKNEGCPVCYEVRSMAIQVGLGVAYPMVLGPLAAVIFANRYSTARIPDQNLKSLFGYLRKITRPFTGTLTGLVVLQMVASSLLTYYELKNDFVLRGKLMQIEAQLVEQPSEEE